MRILMAKDGKAIIESTDLEVVKALLEDKESLIWVDLFQDTAEESRRVLTEIFDFHPLSVDDALVEMHVPKIDDWGNYLYLSLVAVKPEQP